MKILDLATLGVEEMNESEMIVVDGGVWTALLKKIAEAAVIGLLLEEIEKLWELMKKNGGPGPAPDPAYPCPGRQWIL